ncbi:hypothetical protein [Pseudoalteromonas aurantia]|uniref:Uncharacterized protein n=1 Tax=Pseudoalteromonas aurantia 208 TaxID=1314867 RepID=A0ABR9EJT1_9GAMM|nr:hypothetical protein [Pseudoalteromonas aurantia]MBE0370520.1 hypothetical protein [Pseudoalteromonas aurantia 208]
MAFYQLKTRKNRADRPTTHGITRRYNERTAFLKSAGVPIQRIYAESSPTRVGFDNEVLAYRVNAMVQSLLKTGEASLMGNYAKDYDTKKIYYSESGNHAEQQIFSSKNNGDISIYTERTPCGEYCDPMIRNDNRAWTVNYAVDTGMTGRAAIYREIKQSLANELKVSVSDLIVDTDITKVTLVKNDNRKEYNGNHYNKQKAKEKRSKMYKDYTDEY